MNIVNRLTVRHMTQNKRRTVVTIIGVIISVAMVTAVATLGISFLDLLKRQALAESGEWHVQYRGVNAEQLQAIAEDEETRLLIISQDQGFAAIEELDAGLRATTYKPYIAMQAYNRHGFDKFPFALLEGRMPENPQELVISRHFLDETGASYALGDTLTLSLGERYIADADLLPYLPHRSGFTQAEQALQTEGQLVEQLRHGQERTYTIVGVIDRPTIVEYAWSPGYTFLTYIDSDSIGAGGRVNASVIVKQVNLDLYDHAEGLVEQLDILSYQFNNGLLRYSFVSNNDGLVQTLYMLTTIIMLIVIIGSVSLIYNAFGISVADRTRYLGMLASVGATRRQKRNSVLFEGLIISLISIPLGIASGLAGLAVTFWSINSMIQGLFGVSESLLVTVTPLTMLLSVAVSLLTIFISVWLPARRASRVNAIEAIRQSQDIKLTRRSVKTSRLVRFLFGIEAEIGLKNLKRNRRRYQITVFSLVISIILFLTVSFFTSMLQKATDVANDGMNYDIMISTWNSEYEDVFDRVRSLEGITASNVVGELQTEALLDPAHAARPMQDRIADNPSLLENGLMPYTVLLYEVSDELMAQYARASGLDPEPLLSGDHLQGILLNVIQYNDHGAKKAIESEALRNPVGLEMVVDYPVTRQIDAGDNSNQVRIEEEWLSSDPIRIVGTSKQFPMGIMKESFGPERLRLLVSHAVMERFDEARVRYSLYLNSNDPLKSQKEIEEMDDLASFAISNLYESRRSEQQMVIIMSVFTYGFIALITLICIANILNTISTSIHLRKREFAMLKSMGMTGKGFSRMIHYESLFYGIKALLYGLPLSFAVMFWIYRSMMGVFDYRFSVPWSSVLSVVVGVFVIVGLTMLYSSAKVRHENIVDAIKQENI